MFSAAKKAQFGIEYDNVKFKNNDVFNTSEPEIGTYLGNIKIKTTKYTLLTFEYRHISVKHFYHLGASDGEYYGNQTFVLYCIGFR